MAGVAGVHTSAFVERPNAFWRSSATGPVSPGFTPRPSLSGRGNTAYSRLGGGVAGVHTSAFVERRNGAGLGRLIFRVAGVHTSAFVERSLPILRAYLTMGVAGVHTSAFVERVFLP